MKMAPRFEAPEQSDGHDPLHPSSLSVVTRESRTGHQDILQPDTKGDTIMKTILMLFAALLALTPMLSAQENLLKDFKGDSTHYVDYDTAPTPVRQIMPAYPDSAKAAGIEGTVYVEFYINEQGIVKTAKVLESSNGLFNEAASIAAMNWEFTPAKKGEKAVAVLIVMPFKFKLGDGTK
jgi:TonB family protein